MTSGLVGKMLPWNGIARSPMEGGGRFRSEGVATSLLLGGLPRSLSTVLRTSGDGVALRHLIWNRITSYESKYCTPPGAPPHQRYTWLRVFHLQPWARRPRVLAGAFPGLQYLFLRSTVRQMMPLQQSCLSRGRRVLACHSC